MISRSEHDQLCELGQFRFGFAKATLAFAVDHSSPPVEVVSISRRRQSRATKLNSSTGQRQFFICCPHSRLGVGQVALNRCESKQTASHVELFKRPNIAAWCR